MHQEKFYEKLELHGFAGVVRADYMADVAETPLYPHAIKARAQVDQWMDCFSLQTGRWTTTIWFQKCIAMKYFNEEPDTKAIEEASEQLLAAMPRAVQVSVSIPRDYYRDVAARRRSQGEQNEARLDLDTIEEDVIAKVERTVARLIPVGSPHEAISVTSVDRLTSDDTEPTLTANEQLLVLAQRHGGSCLLSLFAVWSLWMLTRLTRPPAHSIKSPMASAASLEPMPLSHDVSSTISPTINTPLEPRSPKPRTPQPVTAATSDLLDDIRHLAESDPATAAAVISRWLQAANT